MSFPTRIYGIAASESPDNTTEVFKVSGCDDSNLRWFNDEHSESTSMNLGYITSHKKVFSERDCEDPKQLKCWNLVRVPFIYVEGQLFDDQDHPFAQAAASIIRFAAQNPEYRVPIGLSVEGGIVDRRNAQGLPDKEGKILAQTVATKATITVKPCNPTCHVFLENDLLKSLARVPPPINLDEILAAPGAKTSFRDMRLVKAFVLANHLKKSIRDYLSGMTALRCVRCGQSHRFFKDTKNLPNHCEKCGAAFSLKDIWQALSA